MTHTRILEILNRNFSNEQKDHLQKLLEYNSTGGKNCRSAMFKTCLRYLQSDEQPEIACCIEYLQGAFLILDDIMDNGTTRRGKPCWHLVSKETASKDGLYATRVVALLFKELIDDEAMYYNAIKFFSEVLTVSCIGQVHDALKRDITNWNDVERIYNRKNYEVICYGKNSYYTFYFPIKLAYILANRPEPKNLKNVCDLLGLCHQIRDDYLNFYPEKSKKDGLDIEERKLTWIICRIVENGYNENVLEYLQGGDTEYMEREARKYLYFYDAEIVKINEKIYGLLTEDTKPIVDYCRNLLNKL